MDRTRIPRSPDRRSSLWERALGGFRAKIFNLFDWLFGGGFEQMDFGREQPRGFDLEVRDEEMLVTARVPGFAAEEIDVQLDGKLLTVRAARDLTRKGGKHTPAGRTSRAFKRSLLLPEAGVGERMETAYRKGVLKVHVPRRQARSPQRTAART